MSVAGSSWTPTDYIAKISYCPPEAVQRKLQFLATQHPDGLVLLLGLIGGKLKRALCFAASTNEQTVQAYERAIRLSPDILTGLAYTDLSHGKHLPTPLTVAELDSEADVLTDQTGRCRVSRIGESDPS